MKKLFTFTVLCAAFMMANAQSALTQSKFFDNWSFGFDGGVQSNLQDFNIPQGGIGGITFNKEITPVYGISFDAHVGANNEANWRFPAAHYHNGLWIDNASFMAYSRVNIMNWWGGYKGRPRVFELEALAGVGYGHSYNNDNVVSETGIDHLLVKAGMNINFNMGKKRAWTFNIKPAVVWDITGGKFDRRAAVGQLTAGFTYHFKNSNGEHHFTRAMLRDEMEVNLLSEELREVTERAEQDRLRARQALDDKDRQIRDLQHALRDCENKAPEIKTITNTVTNTVTNTEKSMECYVYFGLGKVTIDASQMPNVERIATFLRNHGNAKVLINGYASPDGSVEINERIAQQRADAVKTALVSKYKISESRIISKGKGVGDAFSEPDWNRVSICTIQQ